MKQVPLPKKKNQAGALAFCIVLLVLSGLNLKWVFYAVAIFNVDGGMVAKPFFSSYDELIFFLQRNDPTGFPHMRWY